MGLGQGDLGTPLGLMGGTLGQGDLGTPLGLMGGTLPFRFWGWDKGLGTPLGLRGGHAGDLHPLGFGAGTDTFRDGKHLGNFRET